MRRIPLRTMPFGDRPQDKDMPPVVWADLLASIMDNKPDGFSIADIKQSLAVAKAIEEGKGRKGRGFVVLEEVDWEALKRRLAQFRFAMVSPAFVTLAEDIEQAPAYVPPKDPEPEGT